MVCKAIADHTGFSATAGWSLCMPMLWPYMTLTYPIDRSVVYKKQNQWSLQNSEKNERIWRAKPAMKAMPWTGLLRASCTRQDTNIMYKTFGWFGCWCHHWRVVWQRWELRFQIFSLQLSGQISYVTDVTAFCLPFRTPAHPMFSDFCFNTLTSNGFIITRPLWKSEVWLRRPQNGTFLMRSYR